MEAKEAWQVPYLRTTALPNNERLLWKEVRCDSRVCPVTLCGKSNHKLSSTSRCGWFMPLVSSHWVCLVCLHWWFAAQIPILRLWTSVNHPVHQRPFLLLMKCSYFRWFSTQQSMSPDSRPPLRRRSRPCDWTWEICRPETRNFTIQWLELKNYECRYSEVLRVSRAHDSVVLYVFAILMWTSEAFLKLAVSNRQNAYFFWQSNVRLAESWVPYNSAQYP